MNAESWTIKFIIDKSSEILKNNMVCGEVINWLNSDDEPICFLSFRNYNNQKKLEYGYYCNDKKEWVTGFSPAFKTTVGKYEIVCKRIVSDIKLLLKVNEECITDLNIPIGNVTVPTSIYFGDFINKKISTIYNIRINYN
jgi:hypothetical protein